MRAPTVYKGGSVTSVTIAVGMASPCRTGCLIAKLELRSGVGRGECYVVSLPDGRDEEATRNYIHCKQNRISVRCSRWIERAAISNLSAPHLHDEDAAYAYLEALLWPHGPVCPHCGGTDRIVRIPVNVAKRVRHGLHRCHDCKKQFTVKVGTVFEASKVPLHKWLQAVVLMVSSKKGISSHQLHRALGVTYKTAWFMSHRIREAMRSGDLAPFGGNGSVVEADETYVGKKENPVPSAQLGDRPYKNKRGIGDKRAVLGLVERGGHVRTFHVHHANKANVATIVRDNVGREASLMTDESKLYLEVGTEYASHETVKQSANEYVRGRAHTNTIEGYFSIFKPGMKGVYQHCGEKHLHRYLAEFDFRYNQRIALRVDDAMRANKALQGIKGRRLRYQTAN